MATLRYFIDKVLTRLRMETGLSTQIYTEDAVVAAIQHKFDVLFDMFWWDQFCVNQESFTLDGTTGRVVEDITTKIKRFSDIRAVWNDFSDDPLPRASDKIKLSAITQPCVQPTAFTGKIFRIIPLTTTGTIAVTYRQRPDNFEDDDDVVNMDENLIIAGTCYDMLEDDATNPGAADKFLKMYDDRMTQITALQHNMSLSAGPRQTIPLNRWR